VEKASARERLCPQDPDHSFASGGLPITSPLAVLNGINFLNLVYGCVLVTTSVARQTSGGSGTRGTDSWLDDTDNNFVSDLPLLFKMH